MGNLYSCIINKKKNNDNIEINLLIDRLQTEKQFLEQQIKDLENKIKQQLNSLKMIHQIREENNILKEEIKICKQIIDEMKVKSIQSSKQLENDNSSDLNLAQFSVENKEKLIQFINQWYGNNKDNLNIGMVNLPFGFQVDVLPDKVEKHLYVKILSIFIEILTETKFDIMSQEIFLATKQISEKNI